jgi:hypothetical protein
MGASFTNTPVLVVLTPVTMFAGVTHTGRSGMAALLQPMPSHRWTLGWFGFISIVGFLVILWLEAERAHRRVSEM